jgi:catechol 2,3-dioxygenase-like lactoylglutathione lyase family enzyme
MAQAAGQKTQDSIFTGTFSSFSVNDLEKARQFYGDTLGIEASIMDEGLRLSLNGTGHVFVYPKDNHEPATFTVLNFNVANIDEAVKELKTRGVKFESYEGDIKTDDNNIFRGGEHGNGPNIAWFKDPDGNILSVIETGS